MFDVWIGCVLMVDTGGPVRKQHTPVLGLDSSWRSSFCVGKWRMMFFVQGNLNAQSESFMSRQVKAWRCSERTNLIYSLSHNSKWVIATMYWDNGSNHWIQIERFRIHKLNVFVLINYTQLFRFHLVAGCCHCLSTLLLLPILNCVKVNKSNLSSLNSVKPLLVVTWNSHFERSSCPAKKHHHFPTQKDERHEESKPRTGVCCFRTGPPVSTIRAHPIHTSNMCLRSNDFKAAVLTLNFLQLSPMKQPTPTKLPYIYIMSLFVVFSFLFCLFLCFLFPTCQVRVVRFYVSCPARLPPLPPRPPAPPPPPPDLNCKPPPDLNCEIRIRVAPAGSQPRAPDQSVPPRTSITKIPQRYTR